MNELRKFVRYLKRGERRERREVGMPSGHVNCRCWLSDVPIRIDPRIEDDEWYLEQVLSAPDDAWLSEQPPGENEREGDEVERTLSFRIRPEYLSDD